MCGICGAYGLVDRGLLGKMCASIKHRGPDDEGQFFGSDIMLGMRRLKVIDLNTGSQPIFNEDHSIVVVYNGEIYNYQDNKKYLEGIGHKFYTHSDTETIVHLYEEFGIGCVDKLRGMFAFALWDVPKKRLFLARDRIGIKPLHYYFKDGIFIFASEIKALLQYPGIQKEINFNALHDYLTYMCVPAPETIFKNIYKLEPVETLVIENGIMRKKKYWDAASFIKNDAQNNDSEAVVKEKLYDLMEESVRIHLVSDVPLGAFLSGGLDSSTIVALMSEVSDRRLKTFSMGTEDVYYNELDNARLVAKRFGTEHSEYILKPMSKVELVDILSFFDEPFADSSAIPTYYVSKYTRGQATVALSGDGGDEIFGGYGNYKADKINSWLRRIPSFVRNTMATEILKIFSGGGNALSKVQQLKKILNISNLSPEYAHIFWLICFSENSKNKLYSESIKNFQHKNSIDVYADIFKTCPSGDFINRCICVDIKSVLHNDYLTKVDRMSMANSLEVRVPFLDHKLVEFALSVNSRYKLKGLNTKYLLRELMKDKLPRDIINGRKKGFSIPIHKWFREDFSALIQEFLNESIVKQRGYFDYFFIKFIISEHLTQKADYSKQLWALICFEIWHKKFLD